MALKESDIKNFETLEAAWLSGHVCLMEVLRKADNKEVAAICTMQPDPQDKDMVLFSPFAIMVEGNPYLDFAPPNEEGGGYNMSNPYPYAKEVLIEE